MQTSTYPTIAGTISLLLATPYAAPGPETDVSGTTMITSRVNASLLSVPRGYEDELRALTDLLADNDTAEFSPEQQFEALSSFAGNLLERTYDLPHDFAEIISANLADLF